MSPVKPKPDATPEPVEPKAADAPAVDPVNTTPLPPESFPDPADAEATLTSDPDDGTLEVILQVQISGTRDGKDWPAPGTLVRLPKLEALGLVAGGSAEFKKLPEVETAVDRIPVETAEIAKASIKAEESAE